MNNIGSSKILPDIKLFSSTQHSDPRGVFRKPFFSEKINKQFLNKFKLKVINYHLFNHLPLALINHLFKIKKFIKFN